MMESAAQGMGTAVEAQQTSAVAVEPQARVSSDTDESFAKVAYPDGVVRSRSEKSERMGGVRRVIVCYLRKMSPARMLKKMRDCYVNTLGSCAQTYVSGYAPYGTSSISCHASPMPPSMLMSVRGHEHLHGSEFCLSPAFKKSFNESLLELKRSGAFVDSDPGASQFRKSFSDFESCVTSAKMVRTYSGTAARYSAPGRNSCVGYCRRSPGWASGRALGGQAMLIFPIEETPELILASFRKEAQELRLTSFRKEAADPGLSHRKDGDLLALTEDCTLALSKSQVKGGFQASPAAMEVPAAG